MRQKKVVVYDSYAYNIIAKLEISKVFGGKAEGDKDFSG